VIAVDIKTGETAVPSAASIPGSELMTIADPDTVYAKVFVDEADVANLHVDARAEVVATSAGDRPVVGRVQRIATSARVAPGRQGLSFAVNIAFDTPDADLLRPGVSCRAEIFVRSRENVPAVPIQAVQSEDVDNTTRQYVFVLREGQAERVEIQTGIADDDYLEVTDGLRMGEQIITGPGAVLQTLRAGDRVSVETVDA
jgi:HlyD family secretion protein